MTRVLVVDDSLTVRMDLVDAFTAAGLSAVPCASVSELKKRLDEAVPSLIVLDVVLPDGDGVELLKELRDAPRTKQVPILMLSTEAEVQDRVLALKTGADDYVGKPYDRGYVLARARALLRHSGEVTPEERRTVLIVDDSGTYRQGLGRALEQEGFVTLMASDGEEGLRSAAQNVPDAILVDHMMPGIDGPTFIRKLKLDAALRGIPCILLTASAHDGAELNALDAGADAFVRKEEDVSVILAKLRAAMRSASSRREDAATLAGLKRILAVDDSPTYLNELAQALRGEGYDVVCAHSGEEALEMLSVQPVDCILLDVMMPGMSGTDTCRRIKATPSLRDIPLVMLTAIEDRAAMIEGLSTGADDYISKSSEFGVLFARVRAQIRRKQFEDENRSIRERLLRSELEASEARASRKLAELRAALVEELERKNKELEAFSYSVSHDLRAPLRRIDGFSRAVLEDYGPLLDEKGQDYLKRVCAAAERMSRLIDDMLLLSRVGRAELRRTRIDLSAIARAVVEDLRRVDPDRQVEIVIQPNLMADADGRLMHVLLDNLLGNAWKFTAKTEKPRIEVGAESTEDCPTFFVRDNGAGFNMSYVDKLFRPFSRLHKDSDFPGTGIGLATVYRIVDRHGGRVSAVSSPGGGATISFTLPPARDPAT